VLHKTERQSNAAYSNQQVDQVGGKAAKAELLEMVTNPKKGNSALSTDIRYDLWLELRERQRRERKGVGSGGRGRGRGAGLRSGPDFSEQ
jgi:hypothetical protein